METSIPHRALGRAGFEVSLLTCGTWGLSSECYGAIYPEQRRRTLLRAIERGITTFDMAPVWGDDGVSERSVAEAFAADGGAKRDTAVYVTRAGQVRDECGFAPAFDAATLRSQCEASLKRLATDRLDVWLLHNATEDQLRREEVLRTAEALVSEGKVRVWGAAVNHVDDARAAMTAGAQVLSIPYHVLAPELFNDVADDCAARHIGLFVRSVLFHGLLSGVYSPGKRFVAPDHRAARFGFNALAERLRQVSALKPLVKAPVRTLAGLALRFAVQPEAVCSAVFGPRTPAHVDAAIDALEGGSPYLTDETLGAVRNALRS